MQKDLNQYLKAKRRKRRFLMILLIMIISAALTVMMRECSQSYNEPYNKDYRPADQIQTTANGNLL